MPAAPQSPEPQANLDSECSGLACSLFLPSVCLEGPLGPLPGSELPPGVSQELLSGLAWSLAVYLEASDGHAHTFAHTTRIHACMCLYTAHVHTCHMHIHTYIPMHTHITHHTYSYKQKLDFYLGGCV